MISDDSVGRDRGDKFYEYEEGGGQEFWLIDPRPGRERIEPCVLSDGAIVPSRRMLRADSAPECCPVSGCRRPG
ncbi:MAG: hypothetical protein AB1758_22885 [Candidatus Eremiobacterota bacterium]